LPSRAQAADDDAARKRRPYRRAQIVEAAATLFEQRGLFGTGMDQIGSAVGISGPAIYRHFANKDAVLAAVLADGQEDLLRPFRDQLKEEPAGPDLLRWLIDHYLAACRERPALTGLILGGRTTRDRTTDAKLRRFHRDYAAAWAASLAAARPELTAGEVDARVRLALSVGRMHQVFPHVADMDEDGDLVRRMITALLYGKS